MGVRDLLENIIELGEATLNFIRWLFYYALLYQLLVLIYLFDVFLCFLSLVQYSQLKKKTNNEYYIFILKGSGVAQ